MKTARDELRRIASGRLFQARGAVTAKARSPIVVRRVAGTMRSADDLLTEFDVSTSCFVHFDTDDDDDRLTAFDPGQPG